MTVRPGSWHHPEDATHEELIEMVTKLMVRNKRMKKRAGESNRRADELENRRWRVRATLASAMQYMAMYRQNPGAMGWFNRAAEQVGRAFNDV